MGVWLRRAPPAPWPGAREGPARLRRYRLRFDQASQSSALPVRAGIMGNRGSGISGQQSAVSGQQVGGNSHTSVPPACSLLPYSLQPIPYSLPPMTYVFTSLAGGARGDCAHRPIRHAPPNIQTGCIPSMRCHSIHRHDRSSLPLPATGSYSPTIFPRRRDEERNELRCSNS